MSIWQGSNMIAGSGGGGIANYDGKSITENSMEEIQTVGVINSRDSSTAIKTWTGTKAQFDAITTKDPNTLYNITDDVDEIVITRALGQMIESTIPLVDAGLHLLDGSVIAYGLYKAFVDYMAGLVSDYPDLFTTEANWQTSVTNYGVCGKFVYDSVGKTVRLPKITGFTEGTIDPTVLGNLTEAGVPNITGSLGLGIDGGDNKLNYVSSTGALTTTSYSGKASTTGDTTQIVCDGVNLDASLSNSVYGNSSTVQPQSIKVLYYICIATYPKTQIEVDIDEIATDLNGKADTDLSNMNPTQTIKNTIVGWGMPDYANIENITFPFTPTKNGILMVLDNHTANQENNVLINGVQIIYDYTGNGIARSTYHIPVGVGDSVTSTLNNWQVRRFIPLKGVN